MFTSRIQIPLTRSPKSSTWDPKSTAWIQESMTVLDNFIHGATPGSRGELLPYISYMLYRYMLPPRVGFLRRFGLKTGMRFAILVWNRFWFSRELRECMNVFIVSIPNE